MSTPAETPPARLALVDDPLFSRHRADEPHPERPERLDAARAALARADLSMARLELAPRDARPEELERVHEPAFLEQLGRAADQRGYFDADTYFAPRSVAAARRAAGGSIALVESLRGGSARFGLGLLRPPGHHARPANAMGFCLLNNVAVAAAHARAQGAERVLIVDWDVHHGNGTQEIFYRDPSVLYLSLHQWPFYPGTGAVGEVGEGDGVGYTVNVPLSAGADDAVYQAAFERIVAPVAAAFDPDLVLVSAGFDAHARDPLANMRVTEQGFALMLTRLVSSLPRGAAGRLGLLLEGGYDLAALGASLAATLQCLEEPAVAPPVPGEISAQHAAELRRAEQVHAAHWPLG
jgi:acetoin utilization deacetylase AcuC-like enzyme